MVNLARNYKEGPVSSKTISTQEDVPYQLTCKLMQKLNNAGLVESIMGPKGGFVLSREPSKINLMDVLSAIQTPLTLNKCMLGEDGCDRQAGCPVRVELGILQEYINEYLQGINLAGLIEKNTKRKRRINK